MDRLKSYMYVDGAADCLGAICSIFDQSKKEKEKKIVKKREFRKSRIFGGSDATN